MKFWTSLTLTTLTIFGLMTWTDPEGMTILGKATLHFFAQIIPLAFASLIALTVIVLTLFGPAVDQLLEKRLTHGDDQ